ncbi:tetratricopeptide repeat-containing diguanylate cyclase [Cognatilysobacter bugurensis]|uniref:diguanylate cyclase n=1 Tax=Cognatilysobacter bugurensis TaxID=543356 RepID=A0A918T2C4_9GAMM|nr:GGDEF domain-containing protein [Lysobacter bugurensis]GHA83910.1 hypothetical protein GCM10007067_22570 [Lysobacter bugurensis]
MKPSLRTHLTAVVLVLTATASAASVAAPSTVDALLDQHGRKGYASPLVALRALQAAPDRPSADAPLDKQQRYQAALADYATVAGEDAVAEQAIKALGTLATERGCQPCGVLQLVRQAEFAAANKKPGDARAHMTRALQHLPSAEQAQRLEIMTAHASVLEHGDEFDEAIKAGVEAADLAMRMDEPARQVDVLAIMARANLTRGDLDRGLALSTEAYALAKRIGYTYQMARMRNNQSYVYGGRDDLPKFHAALTDALRLSNGVPGMERFSLTTLINLSAYHIYAKQFPESIEVTRRAEALANELGDDLSVAFAVSNRGSAMARMGQVSSGLALMQKGSDLAAGAGDKRASIDLLDEKANVYELVGRPADALATLRRVIALDKELTQTQRDAVLVELQEKFSAERKSHEIDRLSTESARRQAEVEARTWQQRLWAAVAVAFALGTVLLWLGLRHVRRRNRLLEDDNAALSEQSAHDPLTGAYNRRHCERLMGQQELTLHARDLNGEGKAGVGLMVIDVDFFKKVNDAHGHVAGDAVLKGVAGRLQSLVRDQDAVVRWGGEEFLLVLPGASRDGLAVIARRVLDIIATEPFEVNGALIHVTASAGAVVWPFKDGQRWEEAMHVADLALYESKGSGRNRATYVVRVAEDAQMERVYRDLGAAREQGEVELQTVVGPVRPTPDDVHRNAEEDGVPALL